ncbi:hypothetical protein ACRYCC_03950 [Actinomadura scrupuli]|uniref:hypothetical protein n=1 Tax=Actinomadura scrupuli TaxID=559629 RepID=UPI003D95B574
MTPGRPTALTWVTSIGGGGIGVAIGAYSLWHDKAYATGAAALTAVIGLLVVWLIEREHTRRAEIPYRAQIIHAESVRDLARARAAVLERAIRRATAGPALTPGSAGRRRGDSLVALDRLGTEDLHALGILAGIPGQEGEGPAGLHTDGEETTNVTPLGDLNPVPSPPAAQLTAPEGPQDTASAAS